MEKLRPDDFSAKKREKLLDYEVYEYNFDDMLSGFEVVRSTLAKPGYITGSVGKYKAAVPVKQRASDGLTFLMNSYSGGNPVSETARFYPAVLSFWEVYSEAWELFQKSGESTSGTVATVPLVGTQFSSANTLICLGILLGWGELIHRIPKIIDFNNPSRDAMLENIMNFYVPGRGEPPLECTRHLPYFKTLKIFGAAAEDRPALMKEYLRDWYESSRREGYYNSHTRGELFTGYWSLESAAITFLLNIDDSSYRDAMFYPVDLVDYARSINAPRSCREIKVEEKLREKSGQPCPASGLWEALDIPPQRRRFEKGDVMQATDAAYGITVWQYLGG